MSVQRALDVLAGEAGQAYAITWVTPPAVRQLTWGSGIESDAEGLQAVASAFSVDMAFVDGSAVWAAEAAQLLASVDVACAWAIGGVLTRLAATHGWSQTIAASAAGPGELAYGLDEALHELLVDVRFARAAGADVLVIADEVASSAGWLVSPDFALEALVPCYSRAVHEWNGPSVFHSDGDIRALYGPLARVGFAGVHLAPSKPEQLAPSVSAAHAARLCPMGGILVSALRAQGARRSAEHAAALAATGRLMIADDGGMTSAEEVAAFGSALDAVRSIIEARGEA